MATEIESTCTKRKVTFSTYLKWRREFDSELKTVTWMGCATETSGGKTYVSHLKCTICAMYKSRIIGGTTAIDGSPGPIHCVPAQ